METQYCFYYFSLTYPLLRKKYNFHGFKETKSIRFVRRRSLPIPISPEEYIAENEFVGWVGERLWRMRKRYNTHALFVALTHIYTHTHTLTPTLSPKPSSIAGLTLTDRRTSLDPEPLNNIFCIRSLQKIE